MTNSDQQSIKTFIDMPDDEKKSWIAGIIDRMIESFEVSSRTELAEKLEIHANTPSNWVNKRTIPWEWAFICHKATDISLDWLLTGVMPKIVITPDMDNKLDKMAMAVMTHGEQMGLIKKLKSDGFESVVTGLVNNFNNIIKP